MINLLTIAGSDSSGGAGIQGDLKTFAAHGVHGLSVITSVTAQNTVEVIDIEGVSNVKKQLLAIENDIKVHGVKIGMLYSEDSVIQVAEFISRNNKVHVVLDPLMYSSTGTALVTGEAMKTIEEKIISQVTLITPNTYEASYLSDRQIQSKEDRESACKIIYNKYGVAILLKGGHDQGNNACDILWDGRQFTYYTVERINAKNTHGTGCCLSSAIVCGLANNKSLDQAIKEAKEFVTQAILHGYSIGNGEGPVDPLLHRLNI